MNSPTTIDKREALLEKARIDAAFREELLTNPEAAVTRLGFKITQEGIEAIKNHADQIRQDPGNIPMVVRVTTVYVTIQPPGKPPKKK